MNNDVDKLKDERRKNLELWESVRSVDKDCQHPFSIGTRKMTAIDPMWLFRQATERWGPIGTGWGFDIEDEQIHKLTGDHPALHVMTIKLWYMTEAGRSHTTGIGCTSMQIGKRPDDEFNKKTLTDALTNALSRLGFGADVRMGKFEGGKYEDAQGPGSLANAELVDEWEVVASYRRIHEKLSEENLPFSKVVDEGVQMLRGWNRDINPVTVRHLLDHLKAEAAKKT